MKGAKSSTWLIGEENSSSAPAEKAIGDHHGATLVASIALLSTNDLKVHSQSMRVPIHFQKITTQADG
jgi:hypothetical protein